MRLPVLLRAGEELAVFRVADEEAAFFAVPVLLRGEAAFFSGALLALFFAAAGARGVRDAVPDADFFAEADAVFFAVPDAGFFAEADAVFFAGPPLDVRLEVVRRVPLAAEDPGLFAGLRFEALVRDGRRAGGFSSSWSSSSSWS
ncbi:hypothetical protein C7C46_03465, partial [Streptomyces tateyamensis]